MRVRRSILLLFLVLLFSLGYRSFALSPMVLYNDLVAGAGDAGYQDGPFVSALFNKPAGLAVEPNGARLFVADSGNNRIRVVLLEKNNEVGTVAGNGAATLLDGPLDKASFQSPHWICFTGGDRFLVFDDGDKRFRSVDLSAKTVATLDLKTPEGKPAPAFGDVQGVAFLDKENAVYFTQKAPDIPLQRIDLKTGSCSPVTIKGLDKADLGNLCSYQDRLSVIDRISSKVYRLDLISKTADLTAVEIGKGDGIGALASSGKDLYGAPLTPKTNWALIAPTERATPLPLMEVWGDPVADDDEAKVPALSNFFNANPAYPLPPDGFAADPNEEKRFFLSIPLKNIIVSLRDYRFFGYKTNILGGTDGINENGLSDFEYPDKKPPRTFRILIAGDSHTYQMLEKIRWPWGWENRLETLPKRLELVLNTMAALMDSPVHFQVLHLGHPDIGDGLTWANYHLPQVVKKFDVDLCLKIVNPAWTDYMIYYRYPLTSEGIPGEKVDAEYMLKPLKERAAVTAVTKDFYERCVKLQLGSPTDPTAYGRMSDLFGDKQLRDDLLEMEGRPYELLSKKIKAITTSQGNPVAFSLCYLPLGNMGSEAYMPNGPYRDFWKDACARKRIELLDLTDPLEALKVSYYDTSQFDYSYHFNHKGQLLNALVLAHELIRGGSIPMRYPDPGKGSAKKNH